MNNWITKWWNKKDKSVLPAMDKLPAPTASRGHKVTLTEILQAARDKRAGLRGAFGKARKNYVARRSLRSFNAASRAYAGARGPRPGTWWKSSRREMHLTHVAMAVANYTSPPIFTRPLAVKPKFGDRSFHPGMLRFSSSAGQRRGKGVHQPNTNKRP